MNNTGSDHSDEFKRAQDLDATLLPRLICALGVSILLALNLDMGVALRWLVAAVLGEAAGFLSERPLERWAGAAHKRVQAVVGFAQTSVWATPAVLFWLTGQPALMTVAVGVLAIQLFHASTFAYRDSVSLFIYGAPPAAAMLVLPTLFAPYSLLLRATMIAASCLGIFYATFVARANQAMLGKLIAVQSRLAEQTGRAMAADAAKSQFLAQMSHELRTPMNGVLGMAHVLRTTSLDATQVRHVDMLVSSGEGLLAILNDILDLSKVEAGKLELHVEPFSLRAAAAQVCQVWSEVSHAKGVALKLEIAPSAPDWVLGDILRVRQIMLNLVSNAVKFTTEGKVTLSLATGAAGEVLIFVSDTGSGIDAETQIRLFAPFTQGSASIARRHGGTGLGLSICRKLARLMDGEISLESELGVGSTFRVTLPLPPCAPAPTLAAASDRLELEGGRVLVVEDNQVNQAVAVAILGAAGLHVVVASDGLEALERLRADAFDLVLMDVHMPRMDGVEATGRIRAGEAGRRSIPIIALTADAMTGERERLMSLGFDDLHPKPIAPAGLLASIASLLDSQTTAVEKAFA